MQSHARRLAAVQTDAVDLARGGEREEPATSAPHFFDAVAWRRIEHLLYRRLHETRSHVYPLPRLAALLIALIDAQQSLIRLRRSMSLWYGLP